MGIVVEREIAKAEMNDACGVTLWQEKKSIDYTIQAALDLAQELIDAAREALEARNEMDAVHASQIDDGLLRTGDGTVVL